MESQQKPIKTKKKIVKKKTVKRKPRKKPVIKKTATQRQSVTQNVSVVVGEMKQRRRQNRSLFHKQPQRQYQHPPTIIYQQAPVQQVAPNNSITPQPQPQQQQQQQQQQQPQAQPQATPVAITPPVAQPQATPVATPPAITPPITTRPANTPPQGGSITPPRPARPIATLSLQEQIQQKARERQARVDLGKANMTTEPLKSVTPPAPKTANLIEEVREKAKEMKERQSKGETKMTDLPEKPPVKGKKQSMTELMMSKLGDRRKGIGEGDGATENTGEEEKADFTDDEDEAGNETKTPIMIPEAEKVNENSVIQAQKEKQATDLTTPPKEDPKTEAEVGAFPVAGEKGVEKPTGVPVEKNEIKKGTRIYNLDGTQARGTAERWIGIWRASDPAFRAYVTEYGEKYEQNSSSAESVNGKITKYRMTFKKDGKYLPKFLELYKQTGDISHKGLEGKLKRANKEGIYPVLK